MCSGPDSASFLHQLALAFQCMPASTTDLQPPEMGGSNYRKHADLSHPAAPQLTPRPLPQKSEEVRLQKDAAARLNLLADELRNGPINFTPREGKPILGDQGVAYIAESFAFNERCAPPSGSGVPFRD